MKTIKKIIKENTLQKYLDENNLTVIQFARLTKLSAPTLYPLYRGERSPSRTTALRIQKATNKKLTIQDFGF
jgi:predicted transcriptional regulator